MHIINYDLPRVDHGGITDYLHRIGRTARMGHTGLATSFYNDRDEAVAPALVKIMMESGQTIPDFLEPFKPAEGELLDFSDDSDDEGQGTKDDADQGGNNGDPWGAPAEQENDGGAWGAPANSPVTDPWDAAAAPEPVRNGRADHEQDQRNETANPGLGGPVAGNVGANAGIAQAATVLAAVSGDVSLNDSKWARAPPARSTGSFRTGAGPTGNLGRAAAPAPSAPTADNRKQSSVPGGGLRESSHAAPLMAPAAALAAALANVPPVDRSVPPRLQGAQPAQAAGTSKPMAGSAAPFVASGMPRKSNPPQALAQTAPDEGTYQPKTGSAAPFVASGTPWKSNPPQALAPSTTFVPPAQIPKPNAPNTVSSPTKVASAPGIENQWRPAAAAASGNNTVQTPAARAGAWSVNAAPNKYVVASAEDDWGMLSPPASAPPAAGSNNDIQW